jgi:hypothetical protein
MEAAAPDCPREAICTTPVALRGKHGVVRPSRYTAGPGVGQQHVQLAQNTRGRTRNGPGSPPSAGTVTR